MIKLGSLSNTAKGDDHMCKIKWTNRFSGEIGYVKKLNYRERYFENTWDEREAKIFSRDTVAKAIEKLSEYCPQNIYEIIGGKL